MNEQEMYAAIGRKQTDLDNLNAEYYHLLAVLADVVAGTTTAARVTVDLPGRKWSIASVVEVPAQE